MADEVSSIRTSAEVQLVEPILRGLTANARTEEDAKLYLPDAQTRRKDVHKILEGATKLLIADGDGYDFQPRRKTVRYPVMTTPLVPRPTATALLPRDASAPALSPPGANAIVSTSPAIVETATSPPSTRTTSISRQLEHHGGGTRPD